MITVIPYMGLGNRIRCIRSAIRLANAKKTSLKIIWINDEVCPCDFCELFKEIQGAKYGIKIKNYKLRNRRYWLLNRDLKGFFKLLYYIFFINGKMNRLIYDTILYEPDYKQILQEDLSHQKNVLIRSYSEFFVNNDYVQFNFATQIEDTASQVMDNRECIGIHIRQGDNREAIQYSPMYLFIDVMESIIKEKPDACFYVSSDEKKALQCIIEKFPNKCIYYKEKSWDRVTKAGQFSAAVELVCLSRTKIIYGSYWSSFSEEAAKLGNINKVVLKLY